MKEQQGLNGFRLISELLRNDWMIDAGYASNIFPFVQNLLTNGDFALNSASPAFNKAIGVENGIAFISMKDVIMGSDNCGSLGSESISNLINAYNNDQSIKGLIFILDSPGGSVQAAAQITDAIKGFNKPTASVVQGNAASGGYWIASQTDRIFLQNEFSMLGSIGVYATLYDTEEAEKKYGYKSISIYSDESPEKNLGHREALKGNEKPMKEHLNKVAQLFISDIKGKRPNIDGKATKGAMYLAKESIELGLGDEMGDLSKAIAYINNEQNKFYI